MEQLSNEELLFLSNLMHMRKEGTLKNIWTNKNLDNKVTIGAMLDYINDDTLEKLKNSDKTYDGEISGAEWAAMLEKIKSNEKICSLKLVDLERDDKKALSVCLEDPSGNKYVVFRGTAAGEWPDNFMGGYLADTEQQLRALAFVERQNGSHITVVGHSKGGNKAKYVAIRSDKVDRCVSFDGQGFSAAFFEKYGPLIEKNKYKITCFALDYDFVNILLTDIYNEKKYVNGHGVDGMNFQQNHSPNSLFNKEFGFDECLQSYSMDSLHKFFNYIINTGDPQEVSALMDYLGGIANVFMGKKPPEYKEGYSKAEIRAYILAPEHAEELGLFIAYLAKYERSGNHITDIIVDILQGMDFGGLGEILSFMIGVRIKASDRVATIEKKNPILDFFENNGAVISWILAKFDVLSEEEAQTIIEALEVAKRKEMEIPEPSMKYYKEQEASCIIRDFSTEMRTQLMKQVKEVEDESFWDFSKWDVWYRIEDLFGNLDVAHYKNNIQEYHRKVIDINGTTEKQMQNIFDAIDGLDDKYGAIFEKKAEEFATITQEVRKIMA